MARRQPGSRLFRILLWCYPKSFRTEFAHDLHQSLDRFGRTPSFRLAWELIVAGLGARWDDTRISRHGRRRVRMSAVNAACGSPHRPGTMGFPMHYLLSDLRAAVRGLRQRPGFTAAVVLTLAIGIGATTTMFSLVDGVVLRPLPYPDQHRLAALGTTFRGGDVLNGVSLPNYIDWRDQSRSFESLGAAARTTAVLLGEGAPEEVWGALVTPEILELLGARPALGRTFAADEYRGSDAVILGYDLWRRRFGSDPNIVGRTIDTRDAVYQVIGVMPQNLLAPVSLGLGRTELWFPLDQQSPGWAGRGNRGFGVLGKLTPTVSLAAAQGEMNRLAQHLADEYPEDNLGSDGSIFGIGVHGLHRETVGEVSSTLWLLLGSVGFLLLIGCANVANLLLARATDREREMALRATLGARRSRLVHQLLTESVVLALVGGASGVLLAHAGVAAFQAFSPGNIPRLADVTVDWRVLLFATALSVGTGIAFGLIPALQLSRLDLNEALKEGAARSSGGRRHGLIRNTLVVSEVTLALVLLTGAGLLLNSLVRLNRVDLGFEPAGAASMMVRLSADYRGDAAKVDLFDRIIARVNTIPGVTDAAGIVNLPIGDVYWRPRIGIEHAEPTGEPEGVNTHLTTPGIFEALGIELLQGRVLEHTDREGQQLVAVVNAAFADRFFQSEGALGQRIRVGTDEPWRTVVGVVGNAKQRRVRADDEPLVYVPVSQPPGAFPLITIVARAEVDPASLLRPMQQAVWAEDPKLVIRQAETLKSRVSDSLVNDRFYAMLLGGFAAVALLLSAIGIYGTMSYTVGQRVKELGIRMALGARPVAIMRMVLRHALILTVAGLVLGVGGSLLTSRVLSGVVYGITPTDLPTFGAVAATMAVIGLLAGGIPAWRATRVDPVTTLRGE